MLLQRFRCRRLKSFVFRSSSSLLQATTRCFIGNKASYISFVSTAFLLKRFSIWLKLCQLEPNQKPWPWTDMDWWWPGSLPPAVPLKFLEKIVTDVIPLGWTVINEVLKCASQQIFRVGLMKYGQSLIITYFVLLLCLHGLLPSLLSVFPYVTQKSISVHCHQGYLISRKHERGTRSEDAQTYPSQKSTY